MDSKSRRFNHSLEAVLAIATTELGVPTGGVGPDTHLVRDLGANSDDLSFGFVPAVHRCFGVTLPNHEWRRIGTPRQVVEAVLKAGGMPCSDQPSRSREIRGRQLLGIAMALFAFGVAVILLGRLGADGPHGGFFLAVWGVPFVAVGAMAAVVGYGYWRGWPGWWIIAGLGALFVSVLAWLR
jgi:hypothetical protein